MAKGDATGLSGAFLSLLSLSSAGAGAKAYSTGISGGDGNDRILNDENGLLSVKASSWALGATRRMRRWAGRRGPPAPTRSPRPRHQRWDGDNRIENRGAIDVLAGTYSEASSTATAGWGKPIASAEAVAEAAAVGIDVGAGKNVIVNVGQMTVRAEATAYGHSWAEEDSGTWPTRMPGHRQGNLCRLGITTGNGDNRIVNNGSILVTATAKPDAVAETEDNDVERRTPSGSASAWGIKTGTGDDRIVIGEQGSLQVKSLGQAATAMAGLNAVGIDAGAGSNRLDILGTATVTADQGNGVAALIAAGNVSALGIQAGTGDDRIAIGSTGSLTVDALSTAAVLSGGSGTTYATGIDAGAGNNRLDILGRLEVTACMPLFSLLVGEGRRGGHPLGSGRRPRHGRERWPSDGPCHVIPVGFASLSAKSSATGIDAARAATA